MAAKPRYAVELKAGEDFASFQIGDQSVELNDEKRVWETTDRREHAEVRELPFVKDLGEVKSQAKKDGD